MDSSLNTHDWMLELIESSKNLLSTSSEFETCIPPSSQSGDQTLLFLEDLATLTQTSFSTQPTSLPPQPSHTQTLSKDQPLVEALLQLKKSYSPLKRGPGIYSTILRPYSTS